MMAFAPRGSAPWRMCCGRWRRHRVAPHQESSAIGHALTLRRPLRLEQVGRRRLRRGRNPDRLREHRRRHPVERRAARSHRLGHQHRLESRRRCDVFGDGVRRAWKARCSASRRLPSHCSAREACSTSRPPLMPPRNWLSSSSSIRCRTARFSTSTSRKARQRGIAARCRASAITSRRSTSGSIRAGQAYYWIEEGIDDWTPHDNSDYHACKDGYISVTLLQPDMTAHDALDALEQLPLLQYQS